MQLDLLANLNEDTSKALPELHAVHVNHQLSDAADHWAVHCQRLCDARNIPLQVRRVDVNIEGRGLEAAAREARYAVFSDILGEGELLIMAHHLDDQVETFFLRLLRGAGTGGLVAMPESRSLGGGSLIRPLLAFPRAELESYAGTHALEWIEDDSNADDSLDRNFLRRRVLPLLEERWPHYRNTIEEARTAIEAAEQQLRLTDLQALQPLRSTVFEEPVLAVDGLCASGNQRACRLLRAWLVEFGWPVPGREQLREFVGQLMASSVNARPVLQGVGYQLRRFRGNVHAGVDVGCATLEDRPLIPGATLQLLGIGRLELVSTMGQGLKLAPDCVRFRLGGERCRPVGRARSQSLKKLFQDEAVPDWWRGRVPLLYCRGELVAVGDLWICEGYQANPGQPGYQIHWQR